MKCNSRGVDDWLSFRRLDEQNSSKGLKPSLQHGESWRHQITISHLPSEAQDTDDYHEKTWASEPGHCIPITRTVCLDTVICSP